jgi:hypothetical protein
MNNGMFAAGGAFAFLTAFAVYSAIDAARWRNRRRMWLSVAAGLPLGVAACVSLWIGIERPTANFWGNQGFGPDWECNNLGRGAAQVCARDLPTSFQGKPPAQPKSN